MTAPAQPKPKGGNLDAFRPVSERHFQDNWWWSVCGREFTLKSSLACTFPEPVYLMAFDPGYVRALKRYRNRDIRDKFYKLPDTLLELNQKRTVTDSSGKQKQRKDAKIDFDAYEDLYSEWYEDWLALTTDPGEGTIVVDTGKDVWDVFRGSKTGRLQGTVQLDYTSLNLEFDGVLRKGTAPYGCNKHVVWIDRMDKQYVKSPGSDKGDWNGKYERVGYKGIGPLSDVTIETFQEGGLFGFRFGLKSGTNKALIGAEYVNDPVKLDEYYTQRIERVMEAGGDVESVGEVKDVCTYEFLMEELYG